jgi:small-conductance mechanosensitive channel
MKLLERPSIKGLFGAGEDLSALNPQVNISDLRESKMRLHVRVWIKEIHRRDEILSDLISVLRRRMDAMGITLLDP